MVSKADKRVAPVKVLFITHSLASGGTDRVAVHLASGFARDVSTSLLSVRRPEANSDTAALLVPEVDHIALNRITSGRVLDFISGSTGMVRAVRRLRPDVILATGNNNSFFSLLAHLANPNPGSRLVVKITNPVIRDKDKGLKRFFRKELYRRVLGCSSKVLMLSEGEAEIIRKSFPKLADRFVVVQNPYVTKAMLDAGANRAVRSDKRAFLAVGRLHHQKNFSLLLDAWALAALPGAHLQIAGEGPQRGMLQDRIAELCIGETVELLGYRSPVAPLLQSADCLVLSSDYEGLPAVVLESLATACPVISTDCFPAAGELIGRTPGCHLVPKRDKDALAQALRQFAKETSPQAEALVARALPYGIDSAVSSHLSAIITQPETLA